VSDKFEQMRENVTKPLQIQRSGLRCQIDGSEAYVRLPLWLRLFLSFGGVMLLALALLTLMRQQVFRDGLLDYANAQEWQRVRAFAPVLVQEYERDGWQTIRRDAGRVQTLYDQYFPSLEFAPSGSEPLAREHSQSAQKRNLQSVRERSDLGARLTLTDVEGRTLFGRTDFDPSDQLTPLRAEGIDIGSLRWRAASRVSGALELAFAEAQRRQVWWMAFAVFLVALVASGILARVLSGPIRALGQAAEKLQGGDFNARAGAGGGIELEELALSFNRLAQSLQSNQKIRQRWMAEISHELRTPIAILIAEMSALEEGARPLEPLYLRSLLKELERLNALVDDLHQLAMTDRGALSYRMRELDMREFLRQFANSETPRMAASGLIMRMQLEGDEQTPWAVVADELRLWQLLGNLALNSRRYTDNPGQVLLRARALGRVLEIRFEDSAPGVPEESLAQLFEPLFRVESARARALGGAGLGLAIARNIVEAHEGSIHAEHSSLGGLTVVITLPMQ
jgi:two-component system sensor histidine kinase BaeS